MSRLNGDRGTVNLRPMARSFTTRTGRVLSVLDGANHDAPCSQIRWLKSPSPALRAAWASRDAKWEAEKAARMTRRFRLGEMMRQANASVVEIAELVDLGGATIGAWLADGPPAPSGNKSSRAVRKVVEHLGWNIEDLETSVLPPRRRHQGVTR